MSWANPPEAVSELRTMMLACASVTAAGFVQASFHYPAVALETEDASSPDSLPCIALGEEEHERTRYAEGARGLPSGRLVAVLYMDTDAGTLEALARTIADELELLGMTSGLPIRRASAGLCADPSNAERAADETDTQAKHRSIAIIIDYGLST